MATLDSQTRARLPDSAFAYIDSKGRRRLPINAASHVRNALARFEQTSFEDDDARVRIGIHPGRPKLTDTGHVGIAVHTAARVCWAGHGGQILLTGAARDAFRGGADLELRSLGAYSLPGLEVPETLFHVCGRVLLLSFPALRKGEIATA